MIDRLLPLRLQRAFGIVVLLSTLSMPSLSTPSLARAEDRAPSAEAPAARYAERLLADINGRRAALGVPPVRYVSEGANRAVDRYLADLGPRMRSRRSCFHGNHDPVPPGWEYVERAEPGLLGRARGEVLACPGDGHFWQPGDLAETWWRSEYHRLALYADPAADAVACGLFEPSPDGEGFGIVACVVFAT